MEGLLPLPWSNTLKNLLVSVAGKNTALIAAGCALVMSGCGFFLEGRPDLDAGRVDAFSIDGRATSADVFPEVNVVEVADTFERSDAFEFPDAYEVPDAREFPDGRVCAAEDCNGIDDDCNGRVDDGVCVVSDVTCTGHSAEGHTYILCDTDETWEQAREHCEYIPHFHMVKIESARENGFVADLAATLDWRRRGVGWSNAPRLWIGLRDNSLLTSEWRWTDGTALGTAYWHPPGPGLSENCGEMRGWASAAPGGFDYAWNDSPCVLPRRAYLCERDTP